MIGSFRFILYSIRQCLLIGCLMLVTNNTAIAAKDGLEIVLANNEMIAVHLHDKLYLNGCTANPQIYSLTPKIVNNSVYELPNEIIEFSTSPFGRPIKTEAISLITLNDKKLKASLSNFRDFTVVDDNGEVLIQRRISGASSLYEVRYHGKVMAWGAGWHNYCYEYYKKMDFTAFRVFVPVLKNGKIEIQERLFHGLGQTAYNEVLKTVQQVILVDTKNLGDGAGARYYSLPIFIGVDNQQGLFEINNFRKLQAAKIDWQKIDPVIFVSWLAYYGEKKELQNFIAQNFSNIVDNLQEYNCSLVLQCDTTISDLRATESTCKKFLSSAKHPEIREIVEQCFPATILYDTGWSELFHLKSLP
jgi:hypothetical protein